MLERRIAIRWRDLDAYGHVNNAVYLTYLEEARDAWMTEVLGGVTDTWDFVLARVAIDFKQELTQEDRAILVRCGLESVGRASVRTREEIARLDGSISALARSVVVPRDPAERRARPLTGPERAALDRELDPTA
jgi:acyl-CoA thioester hydrolase